MFKEKDHPFISQKLVCLFHIPIQHPTTFHQPPKNEEKKCTPKNKPPKNSHRNHHILCAVVFINPDVPFALGRDSKRRQLLQHRIQRCESRGNTAGLLERGKKIPDQQTLISILMSVKFGGSPILVYLSSK